MLVGVLSIQSGVFSTVHGSAPGAAMNRWCRCLEYLGEYAEVSRGMLSWSDNGTLKFGVHMKPNQQLKYLNAGSAHTPGHFKAIKTGVCYRLTKLTTVDEDSVDLKLDEIYP